MSVDFRWGRERWFHLSWGQVHCGEAFERSYPFVEFRLNMCWFAGRKGGSSMLWRAFAG